VIRVDGTIKHVKSLSIESNEDLFYSFKKTNDEYIKLNQMKIYSVLLKKPMMSISN